MSKIVPGGELEPNVVEEATAAREDLAITRDGDPIARLTPMWPSLRGSVKILGDIMTPIEDEWDVRE